ncbi:hypothetical protein [Kitasatospora sp. NPDC088346]|uniref:hypothetical protein n=1 Tax=Kitasatospora sp. NPDC088346 TaxID=3364073 RepID=UPI003820736F
MSSREPDSANPQPRQGGTPGRRRGEGPDAYPSGTPPYGTGVPGGFGADQFRPAGQPAAAPEEPDGDLPKTETTLTTRIRINIPGSRPIPPVVVRSPVKNEGAPAEPPAGGPGQPPGPRHRSDSAASPVLGVMDAGARTAAAPNLPPEWQDGRRPGAAAAAAPAPAAPASESESTGEWFKPRQKGRQESAAPVAAGAGAPAQTVSQPGPRQAPAPAPAPRPTGAPASPFAAAQPGPAPEDPFGSGPAPAAPFGTDPYGNDPFATAPAPSPAPQAPARGPQGDPFGHPPGHGHGGPRRPAAAEEPEDTQIGGFEPIRDDAPPVGISGLPANGMYGAARPAAPADPFGPADPFAPVAPADPFGPAAPADPFSAPHRPQQGGRPAAGRPGEGQPPNGRFADVPYEPAKPFPGSPRAVTPPGAGPAGPQGPGQNAAQGTAPVPADPKTDPKPETDRPQAAPAKAAKSRGRGSKLVVYAVGGLLFAGAAAYGTGLMMNQSDIPEGTTVLGTDIGGDTRDQAVSALDAALGSTAQRPVQLKVGGQAVELDPASSGLSFDSTATVDALTRHSYNPVEVIGSLAGGSKAVAPEVKVDRAKLKAALDALASRSGQGLQEGFVRFTDAGQPEVVPGKAGQTLNAAGAVDQVEQAFRNRAAGRPDGEVALELTNAQPRIGQDALQAAADGLGKQVAAGSVTVTVGARKFEFGKATAAKTLTLAADESGKIVPKWDLDKLNAAMSSTLGNSKIRKNGALVTITAQDVADAIAGGFEKTGKDRTFKFNV